MLTVPILSNHDHRAVIGKVSVDSKGFMIDLLKGLSRQAFFNTFGNASVQILKMDGEQNILQARINWWSLDTAIPSGAKELVGRVKADLMAKHDRNTNPNVFSPWSFDQGVAAASAAFESLCAELRKAKEYSEG